MKLEPIGSDKKKARTIEKLLAAFKDEHGVPRPRTWSELKRHVPKSTLARTLQKWIKTGKIVPILQVDNKGRTEVIYLPPESTIIAKLYKHLAYLKKSSKGENGEVSVQQGTVVDGKIQPYFRRLKGEKNQSMRLSKELVRLLGDQDNNSVLPHAIRVPYNIIFADTLDSQPKKVSLAPSSPSDELVFVPSVLIHITQRNYTHLLETAKKTDRTMGQILDGLIERHLTDSYK